MNHVYKTLKSPIGELTLVGSDRGLRGVLWEGDGPIEADFASVTKDSRHPVLCEAERQLREYFDGSRQRFNLPLIFGGTEFQTKVWNALRTIPFGQTRSYGQIAAQIGHRTAVRAVGAANGRNPIPIIVPCHRVIGANGTLTGFAGGLEIKSQLLRLEGSSAAASASTQLALGA